MYATTILVCAIFAQTPPATPPAHAGKEHGSAANGRQNAPAAGAKDAGGYEGEAPAFGQPSGGSPVPTNAPLAGKEPFVETTPPTSTDEPAAAASQAGQNEPAGGAAEPAADKSLVPVQPRMLLKNLASEVLNNALAMPEGSRIEGRRVSLVDVLRQAADRTSQRRATEEYWKLVETLAIYNFAWDEYEQLQRLKPATHAAAEPTPEEQVLLTRMSAASARLHDAELAIINAQYDLAATMKLTAGQPRPLPIDAPHVGPYRTSLTDVYQGPTRAPLPPKAVLLDRTLPIRRSAVDARAVAVQAAADALDAAEEAHYAGRADQKLVLSLVEELSRQRRAFIADVRAYNNEIAEYALGVPTPPPDAVGLASMLIRSTPTGASGNGVLPAGGATSGTQSAVERAGLNAPVEQPTRGAMAPGARGTAPPAAHPPAGVNRGAPGAGQKQGEPTMAPPRAAGERREPSKLPGETIDEPPPPAANYRANRQDVDASAAAQSAVAPAADKSATEQAAATETTSPGDHRLYPALSSLPSDEQARHLTSVLFWQPADATPDVAPITLGEYLSSVSPEGRKRALAAYWGAQRMAATRNALAAQVEQFDSLDQELQRSISTMDPAAALYVRAARAAAAAETRRAEADCKVAQWDLAMLAGRPATGAWLAPATAPHPGGYKLKLEQLPMTLRESTGLQRLAATIARRPQVFCEQAASVVGADKTRADDVLRASGTLEGVERATQAIHSQTEYTVAFAAELAEYNRELAEYALIVLPASIPSQTLTQALVLSK